MDFCKERWRILAEVHGTFRLSEFFDKGSGCSESRSAYSGQGCGFYGAGFQCSEVSLDAEQNVLQTLAVPMRHRPDLHTLPSTKTGWRRRSERSHLDSSFIIANQSQRRFSILVGCLGNKGVKKPEGFSSAPPCICFYGSGEYDEAQHFAACYI